MGRPTTRETSNHLRHIRSNRKAEVSIECRCRIPFTPVLRRLCHAFEIKEYCNDPWTVILVDFLYYNLLFCEEQNFSPEQTSTFFSIMKCVFDFTFRQAGHDGNGADVAGIKESFNFFRSKVGCTSPNHDHLRCLLCR